MDEVDSLMLGWEEETVTNLSVHRGHPVVQVAKFNRVQEGRGIGADYLWWWVDRATGLCFGMLVQAKRLSRRTVGGAAHWTVDIHYRGGQQYRDLLRTSDTLLVPAMYAVYMGGLVFREELPCPHESEPHTAEETQSPGGQDECLACRRMTISMISAFQLADSDTAADAARAVLRNSIPLETVADVAKPIDRVWDANLSRLRPGPLLDFLTKGQTGSAEVAKKIFKHVCEHPALAHGALSAGLLEVPGSPLFAFVPRDRGAFQEPYYPHFLRGLRTSPPMYVQELLNALEAEAGSGDVGRVNVVARPEELAGLAVDGIVLVTL